MRKNEHRDFTNTKIYIRTLSWTLSSHPPKDGDFCNTAKINTTGNCIIRGALSSHI